MTGAGLIWRGRARECSSGPISTPLVQRRSRCKRHPGSLILVDTGGAGHIVDCSGMGNFLPAPRSGGREPTSESARRPRGRPARDRSRTAFQFCGGSRARAEPRREAHRRPQRRRVPGPAGRDARSPAAAAPKSLRPKRLRPSHAATATGGRPGSND